MAQFAKDLFVGSNGTALTSHTPDIGGSWLKVTASPAGAWVLDGSGHLTNTNNQFTSYYVNGTPATGNYYVKAIMRASSLLINIDSFPFLAARMDSSAQTLYMFGPSATSTTTDSVQIYKQVSGGFTSLASAPYTFVINTDYEVVIEVNGTTIKGYINGVQVLSVTDSSITATGFAGIIGSATVMTNGLTSSFLAADGGYLAILGSGTATMGSNTNTQVNATVTSATGGTTPYTYQWYRSTAAAFTPGAGNILTGKTSTTLADTTAAANTIYYYKVVATDAVAASVTSNQIVGGLWLAPLVIGYIGDSITAGGAPTGVPTILKMLRKERQVSINNQGIGGTTTTDWIPAGSILGPAKTAFAGAGVTYVSIMLGTNDAKTLVATSAATVASNISSICSNLIASGYKVILNQASAMVPGSFGEWDEASPGRLQAYWAALVPLCNGTTILQGDNLAFQYFGEHPQELVDGVHPSSTGNQSFAQLWASAFDRAQNPGSGNGAGILIF